MDETVGSRVARIVNLEPFFQHHGQRLYWEQTHNDVKTRFIFWRTAKVGPGDFDGFAGNVVFLGNTVVQPHTFNKDCQVKNINFGNFIYELGESVCQNCAALELAHGKNVITIGELAFSKCKNLKSISFPQLSKSGSWAFEHTAITKVEFPLLTKVANGMFTQCKNLQGVVLFIATDIDAEAFFGCKKLSFVHVPDVAKIGIRAFAACESLDCVSFPLLKTTEESSFSDCTSLQNVSLSQLENAGSACFVKCTSLSTISLPVLTSVSEWLFDECLSLEQVYLPLASTVASNAFLNCTNLKKVIVNSEASVQNETLYNVPPGVTITTGNPVNRLWEEAFDRVDDNRPIQGDDENE